MGSPFVLTREQILAHRRRVGALDERLPPGPGSLRQAAWAGLQDSMPRAALLSIHARVHGAEPASWADPSLVQLWGPRYQVYVVAAADVAPFSLGRLPDDPKGRQRAQDMAALLHAHLRGGRMPYGQAGDELDVHRPNSLRYGATTGRVLIRWEGARAPAVWTVPPPAVDPADAQRELARRHLHALGPATPAGFAKWAGGSARAAATTFESLRPELTAVRTPLGDGWIQSADEPGFRAGPGPVAPARLLPSGDAFYLLWDRDRGLLVPDAARRTELWTSRVWPGAILVGGEVRGTWRRAHDVMTIATWDRFSRADRAAVEAEAATFPLPGVEQGVNVRWGS
jgi:Winged helix DNA-binding domain